MRAATEGSLPPVMPQGNLVKVLGREVRQGSPGELMVDSSPSRQRRTPCKTTNGCQMRLLTRPPLLTYLLWFAVACCSAALGAHARAASGAPSPFFTGVRNPCVLCTVSVATWRLFTGVRIVCGRRVVLVASWGSPYFFVVFFLCFCFLENRGKAEKRRANSTGTGMGSWSSGAAVLCLSSRCAFLVSSRPSRPKAATGES